ncbi:MAG: hypothetical protein LBB38_01460 [Puniceicoccales bacterium]|nr:hypothetical protein [Puniceicoccales bacterium]
MDRLGFTINFTDKNEAFIVESNGHVSYFNPHALGAIQKHAGKDDISPDDFISFIETDHHLSEAYGNGGIGGVMKILNNSITAENADGCVELEPFFEEEEEAELECWGPVEEEEEAELAPVKEEDRVGGDAIPECLGPVEEEEEEEEVELAPDSVICSTEENVDDADDDA